jgi:hypothetical protein
MTKKNPLDFFCPERGGAAVVNPRQTGAAGMRMSVFFTG